MKYLDNSSRFDICFSLRGLPHATESPFGGDAPLVNVYDVGHLVHVYKEKCGINVSSFFGERQVLGLYRCAKTGYLFWRPSDIAGAELFYEAISQAWPNYYRESRWEHHHIRRFLESRRSVLEIGCGPGHFLKTLEGSVPEGLGIDFNRNAIENKVTSFPIEASDIHAIAERDAGEFDAVFGLQVLEHVVDPYKILSAAKRCVTPGGLLIFSTPNHECVTFKNQEDAFDLPPHHMGHFSPACFQKIAEFMGLRVVKIIRQRRRCQSLKVSERTAKSKIYRLSRLLTTGIMDLTFMATNEPGENMIVIYQVPS